MKYVIVGRGIISSTYVNAIADIVFGDQLRGQGVAHVAFPLGANAVR